MNILKFSALYLLALPLSAAVVFVSPQGNDKGKGSSRSPFKTIKRAQMALRTLPKGSSKKVILKAGTYRLYKNALVFGKNDSGTRKNPVVYKADKGAKVYISGAVSLSKKRFSTVKNPKVLSRLRPEAADKIYAFKLPKFKIGDFGPRGFSRPYIPSSNELIINGKAQDISRWPNKGKHGVQIKKVIDKGSVPRGGDFSNRGGTFEWNSDRPSKWNHATDVYLTGFFNNGYADDTVQVSKINQENKSFTTAQPHLYGFTAGRPWNRWTALNLLEEIDQPGEYFLDKTSQMLYTYPSLDFKAIESIELSLQEKPLISLIDASYMVFSGLTFQNSRGMGVYIEGGKSTRIMSSTFRNLGMVAVNIGQGTKPGKDLRHDTNDPALSGGIGSLYTTLYNNTTFDRRGGFDHGVINCKMYDLGAGGVTLGGGDRKTLKPAGNFVHNCEIFRYNRLERTYKSAINIDGVGNKISHCLIYDAPGNAILLHGNNHIIEYNDIHDVMLDGDDQGAYYLGRDPSEFGNITRFNYFHDIGISPTTHSTWTIYYDDGACGNQAYGNVFQRAGKGGVFLIGGGSYNKVINNIFIDCGLAVHIDNRNAGWGGSVLKAGGLFQTRLAAVNYSKPPYSTAYPELKDFFNDSPRVPKNEVTRNVFYNCNRILSRNFKTTLFENNFQTKTDPGFVNLNDKNFALKKSSVVYKKIKGFKP
ncbi:MAG: right-handed parallel beta-helix repeat-containing protein, partial [Lentisphaeria bacterium]|nr:right-handed parallel beta-helix repeat-containing protein [Lentisphaeria bacterium]